MRTFLLSSMLAIGAITVCYPVQAQTAVSKKASAKANVTRTAAEYENIHVENGTYTRNVKNGQTIIIHTDNNGREIRLLKEGKVTLSDDERQVLAISPGGKFEYSRKEKNGPGHKVEIKSDANGNLISTYWIDQEAQDFATAGKAWLALYLPELVNTTGLGAEERAERLYSQDGVKAILARTGEMASGTGRNKMFLVAMAKADFSATDLRNMLGQISDSENSDYEVASLLMKVPVGQLKNAATAEAYIGAIKPMTSDYEKARVLRHLLGQPGLPENVLTLVAESATSIGSDYEKRRLLNSLAAQPKLTEKQFAFAVKALQNVSSDYERYKGLSSFMKHEQQVVNHFEQVLPLISHMNSDYEKTRAFGSLLSISQLGPKQYLPLLKASENIGSDYEKARLLRMIAPKLPRSDSKVLEAYSSAAKTVSSKYEYERVMAALK